MSPGHLGRYVFEGKVRTQDGKPVSNAWVKVRGWETLTDSSGKWRQEQVVNCGALREHMGPYEENDAVLIQVEGYEAAEEPFFVKHPAWFQSCDAEKTLAFETVLVKKSSKPNEKPELKSSTKGVYDL